MEHCSLHSYYETCIKLETALDPPSNAWDSRQVKLDFLLLSLQEKGCFNTNNGNPSLRRSQPSAHPYHPDISVQNVTTTVP
jgi:hypothetical protein